VKPAKRDKMDRCLPPQFVEERKEEEKKCKKGRIE
jgi:hypothetical protein